MSEFDIFEGTDDTDALWRGAAESFSGACERMQQIAAESPGQYFVFDQKTHCILARIDTRKSLISEPPKKAKSA